MVVNKITFADIAGVGRASVTLSVQRGKLVEMPDGNIDTENPINAKYLEKRKGKLPADYQPRPPKQPKQKPTVKLPTIDPLELDEPDMDIPDDQIIYNQPTGSNDTGDKQLDALDKLEADIRLKKAQALRHELKYEQDKGLLIPVEAVERAASKLGSEIKIRLQDLPRRIAPRILAMAASGSNEREVQEALEREIDDGIEAIRALLGAPIV